MKKQVLFVAILTIATCVSMSACVASTPSVASSSTAVSSSVSSSAAVSSEETASSKETVSSQAVSSKAESKAVNQEAPTLEEYLKTPEMQDTMKSLTDSLSKQGIQFDISADGNKLIYTYTYPINVKVDAKKLNTTLEQQASTFQNIAATLKLSVSTKDPVVVVRYLDSNKKVITSKEFAAK